MKIMATPQISSAQYDAEGDPENVVEVARHPRPEANYGKRVDAFVLNGRNIPVVI
jgi:hypothetical protein